MTTNLKEVISTYMDMLKPCPICGCRRIVALESIERLTVFNYDSPEDIKHYTWASPTVRHKFTCLDCGTLIFGRTTPIKTQKNYFEVLGKIFKDMEYSRDRARLSRTRQSLIDKNGKAI